MIRLFQRSLWALVAALAIPFSANATSFGIDYTDLWWAGSAESGWGINFVQLNDVIFATAFVYRADRSAHWFSATLTATSSSSFSGQLVESTGPYYGGTWDGNVIRTSPGNMSVTFSGPNNGTLSYNVGAVNVTKQIQRIDGRTNNASGSYVGGMLARGSCGGLAAFGNLTVTQNGAAITMRVDYFESGTGNPARCTWTGNLGTIGRLSSISNGSYNCAVNNNVVTNGTFSMSNIDIQLNGFHAAYSGQDNFCSGISGRFGGVRDVP